MNDNELFHYGTPRHSGRYPYGSGEDPYQHDENFMKRLDTLKKKGFSEVDIARSMGMSTGELRKRKSLAVTQMRAARLSEINRLREKGYSPTAIGKRMGMNESSVRSALASQMAVHGDAASKNADILKKELETKRFLDISSGAEHQLGISKVQFSNAVAKLEEEGYFTTKVAIQQVGTGKRTWTRVLAKPGTEWKDVQNNKGDIKMIIDCYSEDGGRTSDILEKPRFVDSSRVAIRYPSEGGGEKDGVIELRRGVDDISLKDAKYAQVRICVDGTHYIKGMAVYSDNLPEGTDILFNTSKPDGMPMMKVFKELKTKEVDGKKVIDWDNPFGASIKKLDEQCVRAQRHYIDENGERQLSSLNIVSEEGDWFKWNKNLASQFLSKQNPSLAKQQLDLSYSIAESELSDISELTNPTVKRTLLEKFADQCDSDAVHLKAAALPRQATKVILSTPSLKPDEIYAPHLKNGEQVCLVRFPHEGIFQIPTLTVNNNNKEAREMLGNAIDAVSIHPKAAQQLSGADFDGDTVLVIPVNDNVRIKSEPLLKGLDGWVDKMGELYPKYEGMKVMTPHQKGTEMGKASNLITDMTIMGASSDELARAVRYSMVVIDAQKHELNWKQCYIDQGIAELNLKYRGRANAGASTLLSRSTSEAHILDRKVKAYGVMTPEEKERYKNGEVIYQDTGYSKPKPIKNRNGDIIGWKKDPIMAKTTQMAEAKDAYELVSGGSKEKTTQIERVYADHANNLKALATRARKEARSLDDIKLSTTSRKAYFDEVQKLKDALIFAEASAPLERQAQIIANEKLKSIMYDNPDIYNDKDKFKKEKGKALTEARILVGTKKHTINISEKQWEAINAGAVSPTFLKKILKYADLSQVRQYATPRTTKTISDAKIARARSLLEKNKYTWDDISEMLGVPVSSLIKELQ